VACYAFPVSFLFVYRQFLKDLSSFRALGTASAASVSFSRCKGKKNFRICQIFFDIFSNRLCGALISQKRVQR
ncbi:MAG: hypothetical protein J6Y37_14510, partial [Paludibacteraceae bacterium]|nr:hypothetical protein [Paludibacteraceae bacterium]